MIFSLSHCLDISFWKMLTQLNVGMSYICRSYNRRCVIFSVSRNFKITIPSVCKDRPVGDLCSVTLPWPETDFVFAIHVLCRKEPFIQMGIHGADRHIQFRVIDPDIIR